MNTDKRKCFLMNRPAAAWSFIFTTLVLASFFCLSCDDDNTVARSDSRLILSADPSEIGITGTSSLTVQGTNENGVPLPDGTTVTFSVDQAGRVDPAAVQLVNGTATTTYFATFSSGEITITATSGSVQARTTITVADNIEENVFVSANPGTLPSGGGTSVISAVVTDDSGRPIANIGVDFSTTSGTLQSGGDTIETNSSGVATDVLNTTETTTVTATTDNDFRGQTTILVGVGRVICHMAVSTDTPSVDEVVSFFDTSDNPGNQIVSFHWEFGDGESAEGPNVQHSYDTEGTFEVVHSVIDRQGNTIFCDPVPIEVSP
jgi:hypothetical protein